MMARLGDRVHELRIKNRLTLDGLAAKSGVSKSYIWEIENRDTRRPSANKLSAIAGALGTTIGYLLDGYDADNATDEAFYRRYKRLDEKKKAQMRKILNVLIGDAE